MKHFNSRFFKLFIFTLIVTCFIGNSLNVMAASKQQLYAISGSSSGVVTSKQSNLCTYNLPVSNKSYYIQYVYDSSTTYGDSLVFINAADNSEEDRIALIADGTLHSATIYIEHAGEYKIQLISSNTNEHIYSFDIYYYK